MKEHNPLCYPKSGDLWKLGNQFLLVDYADPFQLGITTLGDNKVVRFGFGYRQGFEDYLKHNKYEFVSRDDSWPFGERTISEGEAVEYINGKMKQEGS